MGFGDFLNEIQMHWVFLLNRGTKLYRHQNKKEKKRKGKKKPYQYARVRCGPGDLRSKYDQVCIALGNCKAIFRKKSIQ